MTSAERARRHKAKLVEAGMVQINLWVPAAAAADIQRAGELIRANPLLSVARLVNTQTGRLVGLRTKEPADKEPAGKGVTA